MRALTVRQPWADLIVAGIKDVENRSWPVPPTLPQWFLCSGCGNRFAPGVCDHCGKADDHALCIGNSDDGMGHRTMAADPDGPFPFTIAIHAGLKKDKAEDIGWDPWIDRYFAMREHPNLEDPVIGAFVGTVDVAGCHPSDADPDLYGEPPTYCSRWSEPGVYHWTLANPVALPEPIPAKGRQGLWTLSDEQVAAIGGAS